MAGKLFKYLSKPASFSIPTAAANAANHKAAFSGPINISIVPKEARRNKKEPDFSEPTSPKVSCIGTVKSKHCKIKKIKKEKIKKEKINKSKSKKVDQEPVREKEKKASAMKSMFSRKVRAAAAEEDAAEVVVGLPPAIGAMRRFRSGRESLGDFDWRKLEVERRQEDDDDDDEILVPHSAPILVGGGVVAEVAAERRKKEVELWRRRTLVPPKPLAV